MSARKPKIQYYWAQVFLSPDQWDHRVNWRLVGANGEVMCQSTQGFRDKTDARRSVRAVLCLLAYGLPDDGTQGIGVSEVGPGRKP